jgi:hypothetical protein
LSCAEALPPVKSRAAISPSKLMTTRTGRLAQGS